MFKDIIKKIFGFDTKVENKKVVVINNSMEECDRLLDGLFGEDGASFSEMKKSLDKMLIESDLRINVDELKEEYKPIAEALGYTGVLNESQIDVILEVFDAITVDDIVIPKSEKKVSDVKNAVTIKDFSGKTSDALSDKSWIQPVVQLNVGLTERPENIRNKWEEIGKRIKYVDKDTCIIENSKFGTGSDVSIEQGLGIFRLKNNNKVKLTTISNRKTSHLSNIQVDASRYTDLRVRPYQLRLLTLAPYTMNPFMKDCSLDVNHCIINSDGNPGEVENIHFYEMCDKGYNHRHGHFVRKYSLYDTPVSAFDIDRLKNVFEYLGVNCTEYDEEQSEEADITWVLDEPTNYPILFRRLIAWVYYLKHHTYCESHDLKLFKQFMLKTFYVDLSESELKKIYVDPIDFSYIE